MYMRICCPSCGRERVHGSLLKKSRDEEKGSCRGGKARRRMTGFGEGRAERAGHGGDRRTSRRRLGSVPACRARG